MLGARAIGTRWLGSGRTQRDDYQELSATLDAVNVGLDLEGLGSTKSALFGTFGASASFSGAVKRLRGVSADLTAVASHDGALGRIRAIGATLTAVGNLSGAQGRLRPISGTLAWAGSELAGETGRLRALTGSVSVSTDLDGATVRLRGLSGTVGLSGDLGGVTGKGVSLSGSLSWGGDLRGQVANFFAPSPPFRWLYVEPKFRELYVTPKDRVIVVYPDDQGLSMDERVKQPSEIVDYTLDMRDWFKDIPDDYITEVEVTIDQTDDPDDLESGPDTQAVWEPVGDPAHQAKLWFGGGRDGIEYKVTALVTTDAGRVEEKDFLIIVEAQ